MSLRFDSWLAAVAAAVLCAFSGAALGQQYTITAPTTVAEPASSNTDSSNITFSVNPPYTARTELTLTASGASTATVGSSEDFQFRSGGSDADSVTIVFPANTAAADTTVQLRVFADDLNEGDETVVLSIGGATHTVTITDNAADATTFSLARSYATVNEGGARTADEAEYRIDISGGRPAEAAFTIPFTMSGDYITTGRTAPYRDLPLPAVTFTACDSTTAPAAPASVTGTVVNGTVTEGVLTIDSRCIAVGSGNVLDVNFGAPPNDAWAAGDATITMTIARPGAANAGAYTLTTAAVSYSVTDDDTGATLTAETVPSPAEGGGVQTALRFNFIKSGARIRNASLLEVDYTLSGLPAGMTVSIAGATADAATPAGAHADRTPASGQRTATLPAGLNALVFQVDTAAADITADTEVTVTLHGVFEAGSGGVASGNGHDTFTEASTGAGSATVAPTFTITTPDDDTAPAPRLTIARTSPATPAIAEGASAVYTVSLPAGHGIADPATVTFDWTVAQWDSANTAIGRDFAATADGACNDGTGDWPAATGVALGADGSATFTVHVCDDATEEGFDRFRIDVTVTAPSMGAPLAPPQWDDVIAESDPSASAAGNFTVTWNGGAGPVVVVDEPASGTTAITVAITYNNAAATALSATAPAVFTFTRQAPQTLAGQAPGFCADSGVPRLCRLSDADFTETHPTVTFSNGEAADTVKTAVLRVAADDLYEGAEGDRYRINRSGGGPGIVGGNSVIVVVRDADSPPALSARLIPAGTAFDDMLAPTASFEITYPARATDSPATGMVRWEGRALAGRAAVPLSGEVDLSAATSATVEVELLPNQDDFALDRLSVAAATDAVTCGAGGTAPVRRGGRLVCELAGVSGVFVTDEWRAAVTSRPADGGTVTSGRSVAFTVAVTGTVALAFPLGISAAVSDLVDAEGAALTGNPVTVTAPASVTIPAGAGPRPSFTVTVSEFPENFGSGRLTVNLTGAPTAGRRSVSPLSFTFTLSPDNPEERQARVMALATITNQAVEQLSSDIIRGRLTRGGAARSPGNARSLTVAGRRIGTAGEAERKAAAGPWAANPHQRAGLLAQAPAGGGAMTMAGMLNTSAFSLNSVNDTLTIWGAGGRSSVSGTIPAIVGGSAATYDGDNTAFHIGAETWVRDAVLAGVTLGYTVGDLDWTADNSSGKIRSAMTSVHPYWARWVSDATSLWLSLGYGTSNVKYSEEGATAAPTLNAMMASGGLTSRNDVFDAADVALNINAAWVSSDLGGATLNNGRMLDGSHSTAVRLGSNWEFGYTMDTPGGELRLFATAGARKDYKDAKDDIAYELGGGFQWTDRQGLNLSLETSRQLDGGARYNENHISARMSLDTAWQGFGLAPFTRMAMDESGKRILAGGLNFHAGRRLTLALETALSDADRADYRNLFSGEWRF